MPDSRTPSQEPTGEPGPGERPVQSDWQSGIRPGSVRTDPGLLTHQHLTRAQRWYLARIQRGSELLVAAAAIWFVAAIIDNFVSGGTGSTPILRAGFVVTLLAAATVLLGAGYWRLASGDPAFRTDSILFLLAWLGRIIAALAALACVALAGMFVTVAVFGAVIVDAYTRPVNALAWSGRTAVLALAFLILWSLTRRTDGPARTWIFLVGLIAAGLLFPLEMIRLSGIVETIVAAAAWLTLIVSALILRARVGGVRRVLEQAEPGPAFEPVSTAG